MKREELDQWAIRHGYAKDRFGHFVKERDGEKLRLKITQCSARIERQIEICGKNEWVRRASAYLRDMSITPDDKLAGMSRNGCQPKFSNQRA